MPGCDGGVGGAPVVATLHRLPENPVPVQMHDEAPVVELLLQIPPFWQGGLQAALELDETVVPATCIN